jgi:hypothetical protein
MRSAPLLLLVVLATTTTTTAARAGELPSFETEHYTLFTDLPARREVASLRDFVEAMHATYREVFPHEAVRKVTRPVIRVYAAQAAYEAHARADDTLTFNANWRGYFSRGRNELVSYRGAQLADLFSILSHEGFHQFAWEFIVPPDAETPPAWFEEGLGEYFRATATRGGKLRLERKAYHIARVNRAVREGWVWTLEQLLGCNPAKIEDKDVFDAFYAHAYLFVEMLIVSDRKSLVRLYELKRGGAANDSIMEQVFGKVDPARLHAAFVEHVKRG